MSVSTHTWSISSTHYECSTNLSSFLLSLITGTLLTGTESASCGTGITQLLESVELLLFRLDGTGFLTSNNLLNGKNGTLKLRNTRDIGGITVLGLTGLAGEDDQLSLVGLKTLNVKLKRFLRLVAATVVNGDTDGQGNLARDTSLLYVEKLEQTQKRLIVWFFISKVTSIAMLSYI
jgi:hypothetical protein